MNKFLLALNIISAILTIGTGLLALIKPTSIYDFTGLKAVGGRGITEIRAIFGALFIEPAVVLVEENGGGRVERIFLFHGEGAAGDHQLID